MMALPNLFSRRKREATGIARDVYVYDKISQSVRWQIWHGLTDTRDAMRLNDPTAMISVTVHLMRRELGVQELPSVTYTSTESDELLAWFLSCQDVDRVLDALELMSRILLNSSEYREEQYKNGMATVNARLLEADLGYQVEDGEVIQISSQFAHKEVVLPALLLLADRQYATADKEFRQAHAEFRAGEYEDCIHDCGNALESVLKVILTAKNWVFSPNDTASKLIAVAFANSLIPSYMQTEFSGLRSILESGTPTVRNKNGGHGAGPNPRNIPPYIAAFQLHQTAAAILLLVEAAK
jgi:hypothetical protein